MDRADAKLEGVKEVTPVAPYALLYITRAHNRKEITFEEWLRLTREWAERMIKQYGKGEEGCDT